jgi:hypothetical protein
MAFVLDLETVPEGPNALTVGTVTYGAITTIEETLEMVGMLVAIRGLLEYSHDHVGRVSISLIDLSARASLTVGTGGCIRRGALPSR